MNIGFDWYVRHMLSPDIPITNKKLEATRHRGQHNRSQYITNLESDIHSKIWERDEETGWRKQKQPFRGKLEVDVYPIICIGW